MLLGRTANGLYWMHRYIERTENMARLVDAGSRMALTRSTGAQEDWISVLQSAGAAVSFEERHSQCNAQNAVDFLLRDPENPSSVLASIAAAAKMPAWCARHSRARHGKRSMKRG